MSENLSRSQYRLAADVLLSSESEGSSDKASDSGVDDREGGASEVSETCSN